MSPKKKQSVRLCRRRPVFEQLEMRQMLAVDVTVAPFDHQQTFLGGGAGFTLWGGHLVNVPAAQRETVYDWLFEDINLPDLRIFSFRGEANGNDNSDPFDLDLAAMEIPTRDNEFVIYQEALERNQNTVVMSYAASVPPHLANEDGHHDLNVPNFHLEYAEWLYANLVVTKQRYGVQVDMIDMLNEPDLGKLSRTEAAEVYTNTVPALRQLVEDNFDEYGVEMPRITGASTLTVQAAQNWLEDWEANDPGAWDNLDVLTTHVYGGGGSGFNPSRHRAIADLKDADHPIFIQNEMEFGHSSFVNNSNSLPDDALEDDLEGALALSRALAISVDAGADGFHVFQGVNPSGAGGKSLIRTPFGQTAVQRKGYFSYRQMTSLQPHESDVVINTTTATPDGYHVLTFNKWGDNRVYVNVVNASPTAQELTTLSFQDNAGATLQFNRVTDYITDATQNMAVLVDESFVSPISTWSTTVEPNSVRTFVVELTTTGYAIPVGDLTYIRESGFQNLNSTPQDGDINPRSEILVGLNGAGATGNGTGIMRGLLEFDIAAAGIPASQEIHDARLELRAYRGSVGGSETAQFDLRHLPGDFQESTATWFDPDGDGNNTTGDPTPGGTIGAILASSAVFSGADDDFNANGSSEIFHERVVVDSTEAFAAQVRAAKDTRLRFTLDPNTTGTTNAEFFGFFDEDTDFAPKLIVTATETDINGPAITSAVFNHETNRHVELTFSEEIDLSTLDTSDFTVRNLTSGAVLDPNSVLLVNSTGSSTNLLIRSSVFEDADWEVSVASGVFQDLSGNGNEGGFSFQFFKLQGDANRDQKVDAVDYAIWRETLGSTADLRANADNSGLSTGVIDHADYATWKSNFGNALGPISPGLATGSESPLVEEASTSSEQAHWVAFAEFTPTRAATRTGSPRGLADGTNVSVSKTAEVNLLVQSRLLSTPRGGRLVDAQSADSNLASELIEKKSSVTSVSAGLHVFEYFVEVELQG